MASLTKAINNALLDQVLPTYGNPRYPVPVWDNSQKMFLCEEYESANGHRYYKGVRFCERIVIVEKVGLYHNWTYLDGLELYAFDGTRLDLISKRDYEKMFHNKELVRSEAQAMVRDYLNGMLKAQNKAMSPAQVEDYVNNIIEGSYKSFLDEDYNTRLTQILRQLEEK